MTAEEKLVFLAAWLEFKHGEAQREIHSPQMREADPRMRAYRCGYRDALGYISDVLFAGDGDAPRAAHSG